MLLQQDLFVMTTTTVFRNLEEERIWDIDQSVRGRFNAKSLYELALREDIPWRQWNHWVREKIVTYLRENSRFRDRNGNNAPRGFGMGAPQQMMGQMQQQQSMYGQSMYGQQGPPQQQQGGGGGMNMYGGSTRNVMQHQQSMGNMYGQPPPQQQQYGQQPVNIPQMQPMQPMVPQNFQVPPLS